jgi:hypothetical protein
VHGHAVLHVVAVEGVVVLHDLAREDEAQLLDGWTAELGHDLLLELKPQCTDHVANNLWQLFYYEINQLQKIQVQRSPYLMIFGKFLVTFPKHLSSHGLLNANKFIKVKKTSSNWQEKNNIVIFSREC